MPKLTRLHHRKVSANWLEVTHQMWKLYIALLGFGAALLCFLGAGFSLLLATNLFNPLLVIGLLVGGGTFAWFFHSLRCPSCRTSLVWAMIRTRSHMAWLVDLANLAACPSCQVALTQRPSARWRAIN